MKTKAARNWRHWFNNISLDTFFYFITCKAVYLNICSFIDKSHNKEMVKPYFRHSSRLSKNLHYPCMNCRPRLSMEGYQLRDRLR